MVCFLLFRFCVPGDVMWVSCVMLIARWGWHSGYDETEEASLCCWGR